jgi:DNA-binding CsgD family transcriptional regulator
MEHLSSAMEHQNQDQQVQWRRHKVQELCSKGHSQREIAQILQISNGTVNRDLSILRQQAKSNIKRYIDEKDYQKNMRNVLLDRLQSQRKHAIQQLILKIKEKRYRHCHWLKSVIQ